MALGTTDFEKYPKYQLDKHGKVINQILTTAEKVFGMAIPKDETPQIRSEVLGGEHIKNNNKQPAIFTDDFEVATTADSSYASLYIEPIKQNVAIANYATETDISSIFNKIEDSPESGSDILVNAETPIVNFSTVDGELTVEAHFDSGAEILDPFRFSVITDELGSLTVDETYYQNTLTLPEFSPIKLCLQTISAVTEGDSIKTLDSAPANLYRVSPGTPTIISSSSTNNTIISVIKAPTRDFLEAENKIPVLTNSDFDTAVEYFIKTCDYITGNISTTSTVQFGEGQVESTNITLQLGQALYTKINMDFAGSGSTFNSSNTILTIPTATVTNYKKLNVPNLSINTATRCANIQFATTAVDTVYTTKAFIYNIRRFDQEDWDDDVVLEVPITGSVTVKLDNIGDAIRVKACAECYKDSDYNYVTLCDCGPSQPEILTGEVDKVASGIVDAIEVQYNIEQWLDIIDNLYK